MPHAFAFRYSSRPTPARPAVVTEEDSDNEDSEEEEAKLAPSAETLPGVSDTVLAEDYPLYLPSALPDNLIHSIAQNLIEKEIRVRLTVLETTFNELLRLLTVKMGIINNKRSFVVGQKGNTRAQTLLAGFSDKIDFTAERYRRVRAALLKLDPNGKWVARLKPLLPSDVRMPQEPEDPDDKKQQQKAKKNSGIAVGEGKRRPSWIWRVSGTQCGDGTGTADLGDGGVVFLLPN